MKWDVRGSHGDHKIVTWHEMISRKIISQDKSWEKVTHSNFRWGNIEDFIVLIGFVTIERIGDVGINRWSQFESLCLNPKSKFGIFNRGWLFSPQDLHNSLILLGCDSLCFGWITICFQCPALICVVHLFECIKTLLLLFFPIFLSFFLSKRCDDHVWYIILSFLLFENNHNELIHSGMIREWIVQHLICVDIMMRINGMIDFKSCSIEMWNSRWCWCWWWCIKWRLPPLPDFPIVSLFSSFLQQMIFDSVDDDANGALVLQMILVSKNHKRTDPNDDAGVRERVTSDQKVHSGIRNRMSGTKWRPAKIKSRSREKGDMMKRVEWFYWLLAQLMLFYLPRVLFWWEEWRGMRGSE